MIEEVIPSPVQNKRFRATLVDETGRVHKIDFGHKGGSTRAVDVRVPTVAVVRFALEIVRDAFDPVTDSVVVLRLGMVALDAVRFAQVKP
jgi:hypothetical protein